MEAGGAIEQSFQRFGPYVLLRCSGAGGFGRVDLAVKGPAELAKVCVVKRMQNGERAPDIEARFRREAQIAVRLAHGAIAQTVGVEEINGELCLLQEYVDGANLAQLVRRAAPERVPLPVALYIVREVGRALAYAHGLGIVHRDVTLDNVMLSWTGEVKLIDFGIAREENDAAALTKVGLVVGRKTYTAPEVWSGARADARSDIYSLGVVLWQLVTGKDVEGAGDADGTLPDVAGIAPGTPSDVRTTLSRMLAPQRERRWQAARDLIETLGRLLPHGFEGETAVASFLARHFDVAKERDILEEDLAAARRVLARDDAEVERLAQPRQKRIVIVAAVVATGVAIATMAALHTSTARPTSSVAASPAAVTSEWQRWTAEPTGEPAPPSKVEDAPGVPAAESGPAPARDRTRASKGERAATKRGAIAVTPPARSSAEAAETLRRAREKWDAGDVRGALLLARQAAANGAAIEAHVLIGTLLLKLGQPTEAERELNAVLRQDPGNQKAARLLELARKQGARRN